MVKLKNPETNKYEDVDDYHYFDVKGHFPTAENSKED